MTACCDLAEGEVQGAAKSSLYVAAEETGSVRQLLVDVSVIFQHDARTGIQRVVRGIWTELRQRRLDGFELRPVVATATTSYRYAPRDFLERPCDALPCENVAVEMQPGDIFLGLDLAAHLLPRHRQQLAAWKSSGGALHIIVYDLLPVTHGRWFRRRARKNFTQWLDIVLQYADQAVCISAHVADELRAWNAAASGVKAAPYISTLPLGADFQITSPSCGMPAEAPAVLAAMADAPAILMVGTVEPRKGYAKALGAFERIWRAGGADAPLLLIVGKPGWKTRWLQWRLRRHRERGRKLFWLEQASDEFLELLYNRSQGLLCTSFAEGFGLPVAEALRHGLPVIARDLAVFREFAGDGISYFSSDRPRDLSLAIVRWLAQCERGDGRANAVLPSWADTTDHLLSLLGVRTTLQRGRPVQENPAS